MVPVESQPNSPAQWKAYADSEIVTSVPLTEVKREDEEASVQRHVYLEIATAFSSSATEQHAYTDILALSEQETTISLAAYSTTKIFARVLTAAGPANLKIVVPEEGCVIFVYASVLDQPIEVSVGSSSPQPLVLGQGTGNVGAVLIVTPSGIRIEYRKDYGTQADVDFQALLEMQLRIALALFWSRTSIAISLCAYAALASATMPLWSQINAQAVALGQQLAVQTMTGPNMGYAPVLLLDSYRQTADSALDAVQAFEVQYNRFQDKDESLQGQLDAWDAMLQHALNKQNMLKMLSDLASAKYDDACRVVSNSLSLFEIDTDEVRNARLTYEQGVLEWELGQKLAAAFKVLLAIGEFASGLGSLCSGDPAEAVSALTGINAAITAVKDAESDPNGEGRKLTSETLTTLKEGMKGLETLYYGIDPVVQAVKRLEADPNTSIPQISDISGSSQGDEDAASIVAVSAWDKWVLESDDQMEFAVTQSIRGASAYRLAQRKHAVNGKQLAQAQAEAIKAGQGYVRAEMEVIVNMKDIAILQDLRKEFTGQQKIYAEAEAKFYDRLMAMKTSLVIEMRNMLWAYKYWALKDSKVTLDSQKSYAESAADLALIDQEIENANARYATDFQPFHFRVNSNDLPANYGQLLIDGLKGDGRAASFTLAPSSDPGSGGHFASKFIEGSHFRLDGLEPVLLGVVPKAEFLEEGKVAVELQVLTSGVYADIQDGEVFHFTSLPRDVRFTYEVDESGQPGEVIIDSSFPTKDHAEPTPFTQWTIKLRHPERVDLSGLTGVELKWDGHARFSDQSRHKNGEIK